MSRRTCFVLLALCASTWIHSGCTAPDPRQRSSGNRPARAADDVPIEERVAELEKQSRPGPEHKSLDVLVGTWETRAVDVDTSGRPKQPMTGHAVITKLFGGRYVKWDETLDIGAETHATTGFLGYDVPRREYEWLNITDLTTGMSVASGKGDLTGAGIRLALDLIDPASGQIGRVQSRLRSLDHDHFVLEVIGADEMGNDRVLRRTNYHRAGTLEAAPAK